ncbi:DUF924 family protein [Thalassolituus sp.]|jgi:uncharacterized protein (DUF924 family)|uniref:DUF924 family protein n=1 Tax=Thalassolituus sp. TaxID=2030822 RepID=UPI002A81FF90|nr:DUF924 family protein [Thalassolituus sp.]|tara:strand:- start:1110 stop:1652 length:543 start_codon:yes stop_codon:yes gene_type:complete
MLTPEDVLNFWFTESKPVQWFKKDPAFDQVIQQRFGNLHAQAAIGELYTWRGTAEGRLAEVIVLDQFSRNIYRDLAQAFGCDALALVLAQEAVAQGLDDNLPLTERKFLYMPYMHSESLVIHEEALRLFALPGLEENLNFEHRHRDIIAKYGRYPHRNAILGRESTAEELAFLQQPGSGF